MGEVRCQASVVSGPWSVAATRVRRRFGQRARLRAGSQLERARLLVDLDRLPIDHLEELFVDVLRTRLEAGQRRMSKLARAEASDVAERSETTAARERFEVWTEQQILDDVARQWLLWIKKKLPRGIRFD